jgi:hypothetical protein
VNALAELTIERILAWADAHHAEHGTWPVVRPLTAAGEVPGAPGESWKAINHALVFGLRGLPGDSSLAELLSERRGAPVPDMGPKALADKIWAWEQEQFPIKGPRRRPGTGTRRPCPPLTIAGILAWADAHHAATGKWPVGRSGPVRDASFDLTWQTIDQSLRRGGRGLAPGGQSLGDVLAEHRGVACTKLGRSWSVGQILAWADAYHAVHGVWPRDGSGPVAPGASATWGAVNNALRTGKVALPRATTLTRLLVEHRGPDACPGPPPLTLEQVGAWFEAHHAATGKWPKWNSGPVRDAPYPVTWHAIDQALRKGSRGLPPGLSLARLRPGYVAVRPPLSVERILAWADAHRAAHGSWPKQNSGKVPGPDGESWAMIDHYLRNGGRGLPGGTGLGRFLVEHRGTRNSHYLPRLSVEKILEWAEGYYASHGIWPGYHSGPLADVPGETWNAIDRALWLGRRGLPGGTTLVRLLGAHGRCGTRSRLPRLTEEQILAWADAHRAATGRWPLQTSGAIAGTRGEKWSDIVDALREGNRGLPGGSSLARLLARHRGVQNHLTRPRLSYDQILSWADAHFATSGRWPTSDLTPVTAAPGETWHGIQQALHVGLRGLPGGMSLARLLDAHRRTRRSPLTLESIRAWAVAHHRATGLWPTPRSGAVAGARGEYWNTINKALQRGTRGLPGGTTLARLLGAIRDKEPRPRRPKLTIEQVQAWAKTHHAATGQWPKAASGTIPQAPGETWETIDNALRAGSRGLPREMGLASLIRRAFDPTVGVRPDLSVDRILAWANAHRAATGRWPAPASGAISGAPGERWGNIDKALRNGSRGLPGGSSLSKLLTSHRGVTRGRARLPRTDRS